ncbi:hypothetical protein SASPL_101921 [Salvia splendens]|uniref:Reverse transcriptase Ty1/copia-type domain-containing protein n=1 Tax=Salvia splendens TaxID=180675 RepID=A0A8X8YRN5_SALSN|nr:hypothetical protein SASPL_101921 [Salvia splendens]
MDNDCGNHMRKNMIFDETTSWNWEDESEHLSLDDYESSNVDDEEDRGVPPPQCSNPTPPQSPPDHVADSSPKSPIRKTRSLQEIYEVSEFALYTNDLIYMGTNIHMIEDFKQRMMEEFEMADFGIMKYFLGIQVKQSGGEILTSQEKYIEVLLKKFHLDNCNPVFSPMATSDKLQNDVGSEKIDAQLFRNLVGSLIYLTNTRPDIVHAVMTGEVLWMTEVIWGGSLDDRRSTSGYLFSLGTIVVSWSSKKQKSVALSSAEAEYIAASNTTCEGIWLRRILEDLQQVQKEATTIYCDNMSAIAMRKNHVFHSRSKHIELRHYFIRDMVNKEEISLEYVGTKEQLADFLTKAIPVEKFEKSRDMLKIANYEGVLKM